MLKKSKKAKLFKIILISLVSLVLVIFIINIILGEIVESKIDTLLNENRSRLYSISFDDLNFNILTRSASFKNIAVIPTETARQLVDEGVIRSMVITHVELFKVKRLKVFSFISDKNVDIPKVIFEDIKTELLINPEVNPPENIKDDASAKIFPDVLNRVSIGVFEFRNVTFLMSNVQLPEEKIFQTDLSSIVVKDIFLDKATFDNPIPVKFSDIYIKTKYFSLRSMKYYSMSASGIGYSVPDTTVTLDQFKLIPKYSRDEYNQLIKYNDDLFSISTEKVVLNGFNISEFLKNESINLDSVVILHPEIEIYRDNRLPDPPFKKKKLIASMVKSLPLNIKVETLQIKDGKLVYEEMLDLTNKPGKVFFDPLFLTAYNVTNDLELISENPHLQIDFIGNIMGKSQLHANLDFYLNRNDDYFTVEGKLDATSAAEFNPMVENLALVKIESGDVKSAAFNFTATDDISQGELKMAYENLKVNVLKHKDPEKKRGALSFLANKLIRTHNLPDDRKFRTGIIHFERRKDKGIGNYLWNSVKTGIISTVSPIAKKKRE